MILKHSKTISCVSNRLKACWLRWTLSCCVWQRYTVGVLGQVLLTHHCLHLLKSILEPLALGNIRHTDDFKCWLSVLLLSTWCNGKLERAWTAIHQHNLPKTVGPFRTLLNINRTPNGELIGVQLLLFWIGIHRKSHNKLQTSTNHTMPVQSAILGPRADLLSIGILRSFSFRPGRGLVQDSVDKNGFPWHKPSRNNCKIL